ncbi:maleylpyruvate isomerase family mycothiol-dependent enzyme [Kitasatospora sp. NPDC088346]|uniref:maleylpyruvate isomerase family mycothiol-dependent enzyme n=1 Tax=Kitasatospora sp. NPDC088346 TaxID=3364073 RepID=UPI003803D125
MTEPAVAAAVSPRLIAATLATAEDIARVLRTRPDAAAPIPGAEWSVGEAAAHLAMANRLMADLARGLDRPYGDGTPASLAAANAGSLAADPERDPLVLAEAIVRHTRDFAEAAAGGPGARLLDTPLGPMDLPTLASYLLTHMLGHGYDLARALGQPHMVDRERVDLSLPFLRTAMPRVVDARAAAGRHIRYAIGVRGGTLFGVTVDDGTVTVDQQAPRRPDCTIVTEPVTFFLMALGRRSPLQAVARGALLAWGRRPWLAPAFPAFFTAP